MSEPPGDDAEAERVLRVRAKQFMRERIRTLRRALPRDAAAARSAALCSRLLELPAFAAARCVVGYVAFGKEADPSGVLARAHALGKRVGLVRVEDEQTLGARIYQPGDELEQSERGLLEPAARAPALADDEIELIVVPALGLDERGHRLGYGGGFYDRYLPRLHNAHRVAIAYDFQLLFVIPNTEQDVRVHCIVTDRRSLSIAAE
jgi:5-formyltetrahydrofolate cyclo-ligase